MTYQNTHSHALVNLQNYHDTHQETELMIIRNYVLEEVDNITKIYI